MEFQQLRYVSAIADTGSFSRAAERCQVAQPSLSQQVLKLEEDLGAKLFDRLGRSTAAVATALVELEAAGVAIYADKEAMDATTPHGRAMLQMAAVFAELERGMIRERVNAGMRRAQAEQAAGSFADVVAAAVHALGFLERTTFLQ